MTPKFLKIIGNVVSVAVYNLMKQSSDIAKRFDVTTNTGNVNRKIETLMICL
jgi:hypothetical protein